MRMTRTIAACISTILVVSASYADVVAAQDCGCEQTCATCTCRKRTHRCCRTGNPPLAPILASAPAMMAPIVFIPSGTTPSAAVQLSPQRSPIDRAALRELLGAIDKLSPSAAPPSCRESMTSQAAPVTPPQPPADDSVEQRLSRMDEHFAELDQAIRSIDQRAYDYIERLDARLKLLEKKE